MAGSGRRTDAAAVARSAVAAEKSAKAAELRRQGYTWQEIAERCGYTDKRTAQTAVKRRLAAGLEPWVEYQRQSIEELRAHEVRLLAEAERVAREIMERDHLAHSNGRVVYVDDEPVKDDGPKLAAIDRLVKVSESRRGILPGVAAPSKVEQTIGGTVEYVVKVSQEEMDAV